MPASFKLHDDLTIGGEALVSSSKSFDAVLDDGEEPYITFLAHMPQTVPAALDLTASLSLKIFGIPMGQAI